MLKTVHDLPFEIAPWHLENFMCFRVGTVEGLWTCSEEEYQIVAIINKQPGNGHLEDVFQWFEASCKRDGKNLAFMDLWNDRFAKYLKSSRGFNGSNKKLVKTIVC